MIQLPMDGSDTPVWLMWISINPGAPQGGSNSQYFVGSFNGTHFEAYDSVTRFADFGKDFYAGQFFYGIPGDQDQVGISWASNWQYTAVVPTGDEGWRSTMAAPRYYHLTNITRAGYDLVSTPYDIQPIYDRELAYNSSLGNSSVLLDYSSVESGALYFEANITSIPASFTATNATLNITFTSSLTGENVRAGTTIGGDTWFSRRNTPDFNNPYFTDKFSSNGIVATNNGSWTLSGIIDRSILEVFVNGGLQSGTTIFYPSQPLDLMSVSAGGIPSGAGVSVGVWGLRSGWAPMENGNGTVVGNVTTV